MVFIYLIIMNALGFVLMRSDKEKAIRNKWRIPEKTLLGIAAFGGSVGRKPGSARGIRCGIDFGSHTVQRIKCEKEIEKNIGGAFRKAPPFLYCINRFKRMCK